jgi:putative DNA methylase
MGDLFNSRQKLALITFVQKVRQAYQLITDSCTQVDFSRAVGTYLGLGVDELARFTSSLNPWKVDAEAIVHVFGRQALPMLWDYNENNPTGDHGGTWLNRTSEMLDVLENLSKITIHGNVSHQSATDIGFKDNYLDAVLTDPPYYDNVPYSDLSDFFYVWLKRTLGIVHPDLFSTPLTPKKMEAIAELPLLRGLGKQEAAKLLPGVKTSEHFELMLAQSFKEVYRILKPFGISIFVYAHKSTEGWETVINSILDSKLVVIAAWPLSTEMQSRLRARESAALASSIYIVARKIPREPTGFYNDVRAELNKHLDTKLHRLWEEGIGGGDFFIAAIGSAIEVFGKYEQVMDFEGNIVRADRLLEEVRAIATNYAVKQILHDEFVTEVSPMARFYVLWRWNYGEALVPFDEANKLAHSCGLDLSLQFSKIGFIKKEKEFVRALGPQGRKLDDLDDPRDMIDVMHKSLLLWEKGQRGEMVKALVDRGFGRSEAFYRVAQAISETLPLESKEKKLLDGFLAGRERVQEEVEKAAEQGKLF